MTPSVVGCGHLYKTQKNKQKFHFVLFFSYIFKALQQQGWRMRKSPTRGGGGSSPLPPRPVLSATPKGWNIW